MLPFITGFLFFQLVEYVLHFIFHKYRYSRHIEHHRTKNTETFTLFVVAAILFLFQFDGIFVGLVWYLIVHRVSHSWPEILPRLSKHHLLHHRNPKYNFGVSSPFFDHIFGTYKSDLEKRGPANVSDQNGLWMKDLRHNDTPVQPLDPQKHTSDSADDGAV